MDVVSYLVIMYPVSYFGHYPVLASKDPIPCLFRALAYAGAEYVPDKYAPDNPTAAGCSTEIIEERNSKSHRDRP